MLLLHEKRDKMSVYICPVCKAPLLRDGNTMRCASNHCFDVAAKGYVNLLGPGKSSRGDDSDMVSARKRFLSAGYYSPLCDALCEIVSKTPYETLLDAGCGEGYYTKRICDISNKEIYGLDISKKAAEKASSLCKSAQICVASAYDMPYADNSFDIIVNVFSPLAIDEYKRVLKSDGHLIMAVPSPEHLKELKQAVYDSVYVKEMNDTALDGFILNESKSVEFVMELDNAYLKDLFMMTPYYHKTGEADKKKLDSIEKLSVTASFVIFDYIMRG